MFVHNYALQVPIVTVNTHQDPRAVQSLHEFQHASCMLCSMNVFQNCYYDGLVMEKVTKIPLVMMMMMKLMVTTVTMITTTKMTLLQTSGGEGVVFTKMPGNISVTIDSSVLLECAVNDPQADVMWFVSLSSSIPRPQPTPFFSFFN